MYVPLPLIQAGQLGCKKNRNKIKTHESIQLWLLHFLWSDKKLQTMV